MQNQYQTTQQEKLLYIYIYDYPRNVHAIQTITFKTWLLHSKDYGNYGILKVKV